MNLLEHEAMTLLQRWRIPFPSYRLAHHAYQAVAHARCLPTSDGWMLKVQTPTNHRLKTEGILYARTLEDVFNGTTKILEQYPSHVASNRNNLPSANKPCVLITQRIVFKKEFYISLYVCTKSAHINLLIGHKGGACIESSAKHEKLNMPLTKDTCFVRTAQRIVHFLALPAALHKNIYVLITSLWQCTKQYDLTLCEINPLALCHDNTLIALDAKMTCDPNSASRQPEIKDWFHSRQNKKTQLPQSPYTASNTYIHLKGTIGCIANGAGLAMATLDALIAGGGQPANFLDIGGGATYESMLQSLCLTWLMPHIKALLITVHSGIFQTSLLAKALIHLHKNYASLKKPIIAYIAGQDTDNFWSHITSEAQPFIHRAHSLSNAIYDTIDYTQPSQ